MFRSLILGVSLVLALASCGGSDDSSAEATAAPQQDATSETEAPTAAADADCTLLGEQRPVLQSYANQMTILDKESQFDLMIGVEGLDAMETAIAAFRPYQDIDTIFGPAKEGLNNLTADIDAIREGQFQFGEPSGPYGTTTLSALLDELCG